MKASLVSVVIPVFNASTFIARALDSVEKQTFKNFEVIVVDDGSTDNSREIIKRHPLKVTLITKSNGGVSSARNIGIEASNGKYIAFLDADDEWLPEKLSKQIKYLESDESLIAIYCKDQSSKEGVFRNISSEPIKVKSLEEIFMEPYNFVTSSFVITSNVITKIKGFDESLNTAEDIDLYLRASLLGGIAELEESLHLKHDIENSLGDSLDSYKDNIDVISRFYNNNRKAFSDDFDPKFLLMKIFILNAWCKDLIWRRKFDEAFLTSIESLNARLNIEALYLLLKIIGKYCFRIFNKTRTI